APNLADSVLDSFTRSPLDTEQLLPNMQGGDLLVGSFAGGQIGYNRPFAGAGRYRTPVAGLYLCGGSTHPGGNITGLCGYNAADGLPPKWFTKDPAKPIDAEVEEMLRVIEQALDHARDLKADTPFDAWRQLYAAQDAWGRRERLAPLLVHLGTSLVERAMID